MLSCLRYLWGPGEDVSSVMTPLYGFAGMSSLQKEHTTDSFFEGELVMSLSNGQYDGTYKNTNEMVQDDVSYFLQRTDHK